eukprot:g10214.t1
MNADDDMHDGRAHFVRPNGFTVLVFLGCIVACDGAAYSQPPKKELAFDILIRGGKVVDGSGKPAVTTDIGIRRGRIAAIGDLSKASGREEIDAKGRIVCPGFVDLHSHADRGILQFRDAENYVRQGVTTLLCGNCGSSPVDVAGFFRKLRDGGSGPNVAILIGHGSVRNAVMGRTNAPPTDQQLAKMRKLVRRAMEAGAVGMSTSLRYGPGAYATTSEVIACAMELKPFGGFYATHMRDEGTRIIAAVEEALQIGREAGIPVHISHHKISSASVFGLTRLTLARIDKARKAGFDVTLDQYPYGAGSGGMSLYVPQWSLAGGMDMFKKRIADPRTRRRIIASIKELLTRKLYEADQTPDNAAHTAQALARIQVARAKHAPKLEGQNVTQILKSRKQAVTLNNGAVLLIELVSHGVRGINHTLDARPGGDVDRVMRHPQTCIASDGSVFRFGTGNPHPRSYGCFSRVLGHYVRQRKHLTLEQAVHKMTGLPAKRLGWTERGVIKRGYWADVAVIDPQTVTDKATFLKPHQHSVGVESVIVRGRFVLKAGKLTGERPGRPILSVSTAGTQR